VVAPAPFRVGKTAALSRMQGQVGTRVTGPA
jgi:hypothetical protein